MSAIEAPIETIIPFEDVEIDDTNLDENKCAHVHWQGTFPPKYLCGAKSNPACSCNRTFNWNLEEDRASRKHCACGAPVCEYCLFIIDNLLKELGYDI